MCNTKFSVVVRLTAQSLHGYSLVLNSPFTQGVKPAWLYPDVPWNERLTILVAIALFSFFFLVLFSSLSFPEADIFFRSLFRMSWRHFFPEVYQSIGCSRREAKCWTSRSECYEFVYNEWLSTESSLLPGVSLYCIGQRQSFLLNRQGGYLLSFSFFLPQKHSY